LPIENHGHFQKTKDTSDDTSGNQGDAVKQNEVHQITSASASRKDSVRARKSRYLFAMGIRVACFLGMVILPVSMEFRIALAVAAIFLPYIAVVLANAYEGRQRYVPSNITGQWEQTAITR